MEKNRQAVSIREVPELVTAGKEKRIIIYQSNIVSEVLRFINPQILVFFFSLDRFSIPSREVSILWSYLDITLLFSSYVYLIFLFFFFLNYYLSILHASMGLVFWNSIHLEVASDSFCFLINSSWLLVFILYVFFMIFSGFNLYCWKGIHFS